MITPEEALQLVYQRVQPATPIQRSLEELPGLVLAEALQSPIPVPPFRQSSMDGYAIRVVPGRDRFHLTGETPAGAPPGPPLEAGSAWRVFTGAPIPDGADAVVRQEMAETYNEDGQSWVRFSGEHQEAGRFVRNIGSAVASGETILESGTCFGPGALSLVASCGIDRAMVYPRPAVAILASGDELQTPGKPLQPGQIYESNGLSLRTAVHNAGASKVDVERVPDDPVQMAGAVLRALGPADRPESGTIGSEGMLLLSGGISVGDHDHVGRVLREAGVEEVFYRVAQKPGKPLFFGMRGQQLVFALPGNPASALVTFWIYARTALRLRMGHGLRGQAGLQRAELPLLAERRNASPRMAYERAALDAEGKVQPLDGQNSYQMKALAQADVLLQLPPGSKEQPARYTAGDLIPVYLLPESERSM
jgi:molybdopterin molybdotransferase